MHLSLDILIVVFPTCFHSCRLEPFMQSLPSNAVATRWIHEPVQYSDNMKNMAPFCCRHGATERTRNTVARHLPPKEARKGEPDRTARSAGESAKYRPVVLCDSSAGLCKSGFSLFHVARFSGGPPCAGVIISRQANSSKQTGHQRFRFILLSFAETRNETIAMARFDAGEVFLARSFCIVESNGVCDPCSVWLWLRCVCVSLEMCYQLPEPLVHCQKG
jgi:hypothetical protein